MTIQSALLLLLAAAVGCSTGNVRVATPEGLFEFTRLDYSTNSVEAFTGHRKDGSQVFAWSSTRTGQAESGQAAGRVLRDVALTYFITEAITEVVRIITGAIPAKGVGP